jgi:hypothetical protein
VLSKEDRQLAIERLKIEYPGITQKELAEKLGVDERTIRRDQVERKEDKKLIKSEIALNPHARNTIIDKTLDTYGLIQNNILKTQAATDRLDDILSDENLLCSACQRKLDPTNSDRYANLFKGREVLTRQAELLAKMYGQISDSPVILALKSDEDHERIIRHLNRLPEFGRKALEELEPDMIALGLDEEALVKVRALFNKLGPGIARELYYEMNRDDERRRRRMPEFTEIVQGEYRELPSGE